MPRMTPEEEASYALDFGVSRDDLPPDARAAYDRLLRDRPADSPMSPSASPAPPARSAPDVRAGILQQFKRMNRKYALPFEKDRLAWVSVAGGNWEEYGSIVLQMAILDTLLSIEELLSRAKDTSPGAEQG